MRVHILPGGCAGICGFALTGFVVDRVLAIDAGPLGMCGTPIEQAAIRDVLLTHSHIDHIAGLPIFLDNTYRLSPSAPTIHGIVPTLDSLQKDLFNDRLMPDFIGMSEHMPPFLEQNPVSIDRPFRVGPYTVTALEVDHTVPTVAYIVDDGQSAIAVVTDTEPVPWVIDQLAKHPRLRAVFLESSFPKEMTAVAAITKHLTTEQFAEAARRLPAGVRVFPIHIKPKYASEVIAELQALHLPSMTILEPGTVVEI